LSQEHAKFLEKKQNLAPYVPLRDLFFFFHCPMTAVPGASPNKLLWVWPEDTMKTKEDFLAAVT
jgi:hypothetical protein